MFRRKTKIFVPTADMVRQQIDQAAAVLEQRFEDRERSVAAREKRLAAVAHEVQQLLALIADLGHPSTAALMRRRFEKIGVRFDA